MASACPSPLRSRMLPHALLIGVSRWGTKNSQVGVCAKDDTPPRSAVNFQ